MPGTDTLYDLVTANDYLSIWEVGLWLNQTATCP